MATRRMFSKDIVCSDAFMDMPKSSQLLYFHLCMEADDDGFVGNTKGLTRMVGAGDDDLKILVSKRFLLAFPSGVVVVKHWRINNYIQKDRYHETKYQDEKKSLFIKENEAYTECIQNAYKMDTEVRLGKDSIGNDEETIMKKNSFRYREDLPSDTFEDVIDAETGAPETPGPKTKATERYWEMIHWAETRRGFPFLKKSIKKQFSAFKEAKENEIKPDALKNRWIEMENDNFWKAKGFDWLNVLASFDKKR